MEIANAPKMLCMFMYAVMKEARRTSLVDVLENFDVTMEEYDEISEWFFKNFQVKI